METIRNPQRLEDCPAQAGHAGRAPGAPPGLGFDGRRAWERDRQQPQQAVSDQAEGSVALERGEGPLATVGKAAHGFQLVEASLNGMITNDKFCCIRWEILRLSWWRRPKRLRG